MAKIHISGKVEEVEAITKKMNESLNVSEISGLHLDVDHRAWRYLTTSEVNRGRTITAGPNGECADIAEAISKATGRDVIILQGDYDAAS